MRRWVAVVALAGSLLAACGGDSPSVSGDAASELRAQVTAVRTAAGAHDADGAAHALDTLRASLVRLRRSGDVSSARAAEILAAARVVREQLVSITTTTTTTTTTVPTTLPSAPADDNGEGKGKDRDEDED